jgi:hypothetical protein
MVGNVTYYYRLDTTNFMVGNVTYYYRLDTTNFMVGNEYLACNNMWDLVSHYTPARKTMSHRRSRSDQQWVTLADKTWQISCQSRHVNINNIFINV